MENYELLLDDMRNRLNSYEKVPYGEAVGAPYPYNTKGDMVWNDPEPYFIERSISSITELMERAEKAERERDAAVSDISKIIAKTEWIRMVYGIDDPNTDMRLAELCCGYCSNCGEDCYEQGNDYQCVNFKWNGGRDEHGECFLQR